MAKVLKMQFTFQSTLPAGGATAVCLRLFPQEMDFNPRSPQGERRYAHAKCFHAHNISIHAPRRGSDIGLGGIEIDGIEFQSTLPAGGATRSQWLFEALPEISIHAPRRGSDQASKSRAQALNISIHAPRRGSDSTVKAYSNDRIKRSTLREPHFLFSKNACFSPIFSMCATTSRTKNQRIRVSFGSYPGLAPTCFTLAWYRFPRL